MSVTLLAAGDARGALAAAQRSREIFEALLKSAPDSTDYQWELSGSYAKLGALFQKLGNKSDALSALTEGRTIIARLCRISPDNAQWRQDLAWFEKQLQSLNN